MIDTMRESCASGPRQDVAKGEQDAPTLRAQATAATGKESKEQEEARLRERYQDKGDHEHGHKAEPRGREEEGTQKR